MVDADGEERILKPVWSIISFYSSGLESPIFPWGKERFDLKRSEVRLYGRMKGSNMKAEQCVSINLWTVLAGQALRAMQCTFVPDS